MHYPSRPLKGGYKSSYSSLYPTEQLNFTGSTFHDWLDGLTIAWLIRDKKWETAAAKRIALTAVAR